MICVNPKCPDMRDLGVPGEYQPGLTTCPQCGSPLQEPGSAPTGRLSRKERARVEAMDSDDRGDSAGAAAGTMICLNPGCPDMRLLGVRGEYRSGITECPKCGAPLREEFSGPRRENTGGFDPAVPYAGESALEDHVLVETYPFPDHAQLPAKRLLAEGLHPKLILSGYQGTPSLGQGFYSPTRLIVPVEEADDARALLSRIRSDLEEDRESGLTLMECDITTLPVDAIVNAANETLLGGGGVDGAIHSAAGPELLAECRGLGGCRPGHAKITRGYRLPAAWVIHTVGPVWHGGDNNEDEILRRCYRSCFAIAREKKLESIAFPSISTGAFRYPLAKASRIAVEEILRALEESPSLSVIVSCFSPEVTKAYEAALADLEGGS